MDKGDREDLGIGIVRIIVRSSRVVVLKIRAMLEIVGIIVMVIDSIVLKSPVENFDVKGIALFLQQRLHGIFQNLGMRRLASGDRDDLCLIFLFTSRKGEKREKDNK